MSKSRSSWHMALPLVAVFLIAAGWCAFWYIAAANAKQSFAAAVERADAAGNAIDCREPVWGGFPFRIALDCASLHVRFATDRGTTAIDTGTMRAVALAYRPRHVIAEVAGPVRIERAGANAASIAIDTAQAPVRMSVIFAGRRPDQVSVLAEDATGTFAIGSEDVPETLTGTFTAERTNIHLSIANEAGADAPPLDILARLDNVVAVSPQFSELGLGEDELRIATAQLDGTATSLPLDPGLSLSERARRWQADGGRLQVRLFRLDTNLLGTSSQGEVLLDDEGRLEGDLTTAVRGFDEFLARLREANLIKDDEARAAEAILVILGRASDDPDDPALQIQTDLKMGRFYFGPFKIAQLPSLF
jgi:hypothetical protein